ncbi:hypothetical protein Lalb_Chr01g0009131 [Lupinus albus]|uniref:Uncharacterized protein n=1 Tax=Lupinus albus TaxID=3870 RepID=A0A6A4R4N3_LUPAL|nr:hypothetical protein Lalb_Chr01g0009131 [Lupinus albus]
MRSISAIACTLMVLFPFHTSLFWLYISITNKFFHSSHFFLLITKIYYIFPLSLSHIFLSSHFFLYNQIKH